MISNSVAPYATTTHLVVSLASFLLVYGIYKIFAFIYGELTSPLRDVPGPPNPSFIYGNFKQLSESVSQKAQYHSLTRCLNGCIPNRIIPCCWRIGSTNTDRQSVSKLNSAWVDYIIDQYLVIYTSQSRVVLWPPISKQPITFFSIVMTTRNPRRSGVSVVNSSEVVRFCCINSRGDTLMTLLLFYRTSECWRRWA